MITVLVSPLDITDFGIRGGTENIHEHFLVCPQSINGLEKGAGVDEGAIPERPKHRLSKLTAQFASELLSQILYNIATEFLSCISGP